MTSESIIKDGEKRSLGKNLYTDTNKRREVITKTSSFATSSVLLADIPGTEISFTLEKETTVVIMYTGMIYIAIRASGYIARSTINIDGNDQPLRFFSKDTGKAETGTCLFIETMSAGSHTIKGRLATDDNMEFVEAIISNARLTIIY